jgi:hypothetical protein
LVALPKVFSTEPRWAMLVVVEAKVWKIIVVKMDKIQVQSKFFALSLDGLDKWSLDLRFQVEIVSGGTNFGPQNLLEWQEVTLVVLRSSERVAVS